MRWKSHVRFGGAGRGNDQPRCWHRAPVRPPTTSTSASKRTACAVWSSWACARRDQRARRAGRRLPRVHRSWAEVLRWLKDRGLSAPVLAVGDGALGFWAALRDVFPETREQRCWVHVTANCLDALPKRLHAQAKEAIAKIYSAPRARRSRRSRPSPTSSAPFDKAVKKITGHLDVLLAFYDFPLEHWIHLRTTNPIESTFSTVRLRTKVTRGAARVRPAWPWPTSCSTPPRIAGAASTATSSSRWSAPGPRSSTASYKRGV